MGPGTIGVTEYQNPALDVRCTAPGFAAPGLGEALQNQLKNTSFDRSELGRHFCSEHPPESTGAPARYLAEPHV